jgi:hypothetical protein
MSAVTHTTTPLIDITNAKTVFHTAADNGHILWSERDQALAKALRTASDGNRRDAHGIPGKGP